MIHSAALRGVLVPLATFLMLAGTGCASRPVADLADGDQLSIEGTIVSVDTQPWTYDGHAVVVLDTRERGAVTVHLPARWNLCKAAPVEIESLNVGVTASLVGSASADGAVVVCERETHRLVVSR